MKLFIPAVGYRIKLTEDWKFDVYDEYRNSSLIDAIFAEDEGDECVHFGRTSAREITLPAGTVLEVDRVYVRTQSKSAQSSTDDYDSLTFKIIEHPVLGSKRKYRFWAKLADVNRIEYELPENFTEGKDKARENATKPKKLTADTVRKEVVSYDVVSYIIGLGNNDTWRVTAPNWADAAARRQFTTTVEAFKRSRVAHQRSTNSHVYEPSSLQVITEIMRGKVTFRRDETTGECSREFRWEMPNHNSSYTSNMSNFWIRVHSGKDDMEIQRIEMGF